jgi:monoamine oxidase
MKVMVIGAGVAGLAAAQALTAGGVSVQIIEARHRIGGRIHTVRDPADCAPIELGAEFIHGKPPEIFSICQAAGIEPVEMKGEHWHDPDGQGQDQDPSRRFSEVDQVLEQMTNPRLADQTFLEFLRNAQPGPEAAHWAAAYVEGFNAARADRISIRALAHEMQAAETIEGHRSFRLAEGYDHVPQWLWQQCERQSAALHLGTVVSRLRWGHGWVEAGATTSHPGQEELFAADRVIVTVPLGVLKAPPGSVGAISFNPDLPSVRAALERLEMGQAIRITLVFNRAFWTDHRKLPEEGFIHSRSERFPTWWTGLRGPEASSNLLFTGWTGGPKAEKLSVLSDQEVAECALDALAKILGQSRKAAYRYVVSWHVHNWWKDPFSRGVYSYAGVGGLEARQALATPIENTLYFAGEAANTEGHSATVHGAIASGQSAARRILEA